MEETPGNPGDEWSLRPDSDGASGPRPRVFKVAELTRLIKATIERAFGNVWVEGEISNLRQPASGHLYFTIKDESAQLAAVLFRGNRRGLAFQPRDGLQVRIQGELTVYERSGSYQVIVRRMEESGKGVLHARFEALKERLRQEGLFDPARKRPIPALPRSVALVTSPTGAAIRDILSVIRRRHPNLRLTIAPVRVQGDGAAAEIAHALDALNAMGSFDVIVVSRGGGSLEDLWCFNEEIVARAIARSRIPVISAVGHEIDFTISDFTADLRAPTPSAAAEMLVERADALEDRIAGLDRRLRRAAGESLLRAHARLNGAAGSYVFREPLNLARRHRDRLASCRMRMEHRLRDTVRNARQRLDETAMTLGHRAIIRVQTARHEIRRLDGQLRALSPLSVLARGYSVTCDERGRPIRQVAEATAGRRIVTRVSDGQFASVVAEPPGESTL